MSLETGVFRFGDFRYDAGENVLFRAECPLAVTPKTLKLLQVLIEKRGHVVEKAELLDAVWDNSFVEEINIAFTINLLRRALNDDAKNPRFVQTVPRRGYRFIGKVTEGVEEVQAGEVEAVGKRFRTFAERLALTIAAIGILLVGAVFVLSWYTGHRSVDLPILANPFNLEKLTTNGEVSHVATSPDGKFAVYSNGIGREKESVWLRQLENGDSVQIIQPSEDFYGGFMFSSDSKFVYFTRSPQDRRPGKQFDIYRVSIFGGVPEKILDSAQGWISISPDGSKLSFVRCDYSEEESCSLWIADSENGQNERRIISRPKPFRIGVNRFSPDGRSIAFAVGQSENGANDFSLEEVRLENGAVRDLAAEKFFDITGIAWLPDDSGLLLTTWKSTERNGRIWLVRTPSGEVQPVTKDSETYSGLSVDQMGDVLTATQVTVDFHIHLLNLANAPTDHVLAEAVNVVYAPDGGIVFTSAMNGNDEIWSINSDGSDQRQLTKDEGGNGNPIVSSDNRFIYYMSNRTGSAEIWRIDRDGSNATQITRTEGGIPISVSMDGKWIYYHNGRNRTLWKVSSSGAEEQPVLNAPQHQFAISPDCSRAAFADVTGLSVVSLEEGSVAKRFDIGEDPAQILQLHWTPDGRELAYISRRGGRLYLKFLPMSGAQPRGAIDLGTQGLYEQSGIAFAPDGKTAAIVRGGWKKDAVIIRGLK